MASQFGSFSSTVMAQPRRSAPSTWHLQINGRRDGLSDARDTRDYAAMATPVTSAQVAKAWVRPDRRFAAVSWSRRRGKTLAT